jgi:hypothetical protein
VTFEVRVCDEKKSKADRERGPVLVNETQKAELRVRKIA